MVALVDIANAAMTKLGARRVTAGFLTAPTNENERLLAECFARLRDAELMLNTWRFALKYDSWAVSAVAPAWRWGYAYPLPGDFIRLVSLEENSTPYVWAGEPDWTIAAHPSTSAADAPMISALLTDYTAPLKVSYIQQVTDPDRMHPLFREALAARIAMELAQPITQDANKRAAAANEYAVGISRAAMVDAIMAPPDETTAEPWLTARM